MKKWLILSIVIFSILATFCFLGIKKNKSGNNNINQDNVKDIFNMKEYEAEIEVTIKSNKNENKYKIKQEYKENKSSQEIIEPDHLKGVKITKQGNKITLQNTELNLNKIFEEYTGTAQNDMDLESFIKDFNQNAESSLVEEDGKEIRLQTISNNNNKYTKNKVLYIDKNTGKPIKMEVKDINKKTTIYIVYNKVELK